MLTLEGLCSTKSGHSYAKEKANSGKTLSNDANKDCDGHWLSTIHRLCQVYRTRHTDAEELEALERRAGKIAVYLLYALCAYGVVQAVWGLMRRHAAETSFWGIAVSAAAACGMPLLAKAKIRVADRIDSAALRADAMETFTCGYLSWVLLAGLVTIGYFIGGGWTRPPYY